MTNITALAQRMKAAAEREMIFRDTDETSNTWQYNVTPENVLALLEALEKAQLRIDELESKLAKPVLLPKTNGYWTEQEKAYEEAITLAKRQIRLAGFRCEEDE